MNPSQNHAYKEIFLNGLAGLTGLSHAQLKEYGKANSIFNIMDYPELVDPTPEQLERIELLKKLIKSYNVLRTAESTRMALNDVSTAGRYFVSFLEGKKDREAFMVAFMDTKLRIIETRIMSEGDINSASVYPKDILKRALDCRCSSIFLAHNHPSGDPTPSREDIALTQRLANIFEPIGIQINDHFIIGGMNYYSLKENGESCFDHRDTANYQPIYYHRDAATGDHELEP